MTSFFNKATSGLKNLGEDLVKGYSEYKDYNKIKNDFSKLERELMAEIERYQKMNKDLALKIMKLTGRMPSWNTMDGEGILSHFSNKIEQIAETNGMRIAHINRALSLQKAIYKRLMQEYEAAKNPDRAIYE